MKSLFMILLLCLALASVTTAYVSQERYVRLQGEVIERQHRFNEDSNLALWWAQQRVRQLEEEVKFWKGVVEDQATGGIGATVEPVPEVPSY